MNNGMQSIIRSMRDKGYKVRITHYRMTQDGLLPSRDIREWNHYLSLGEIESKYCINPLGGKVECEILTPEGNKIVAESNCSERDNFKRSVGTAIAFGRAVKQLGNV